MTTDLDLLVQACRNVKEQALKPIWPFGFSHCHVVIWRSEYLAATYQKEPILKEYNRLLRLKKKRKRAA